MRKPECKLKKLPQSSFFHGSRFSKIHLTIFAAIFAGVGIYVIFRSLAAGYNTYYIDYSSGSDSNSGTSESSPWKEAPGMQGFTGIYTHQAGDHFIFKGGVAWPNSVFPLVPVASGNSSSNDYYGVDQTWYAGGNFSRPIFDAQNTDINSGGKDIMINLNNADYITLDDIELENFRGDSNTSTTYASCAMISTATDQHLVLNRLYMHSVYASKGLDCYMVLAATYAPFAGSSLLENSTLTSDNTAYMTGVKCFGNVENDEIGGMYNLVFPCGHGQISGNSLHDCADVGMGSPTDGGTSTGLHNNAVEALVSDGAFYIHDNVIHDTTVPSATDNECESMIIGNANETDYVYNNVLYNINGNSPTVPQNASITGVASYFWNNTIEAGRIGNSSPVESCVRNNNSGQPLTVENNLCITSAASAIQGSGMADHNLLMTPSQASTAGYTNSQTYAFSPSSNSSPTVGVGINLTSTCNSDSNLASLCSDTTYAGVRTVAARPASTAWDLGAYQYSNATLTCDLTATISNFASQISAATPGQTVCLASGDYSSFTGTSKSAPGITITAAPGATVTFNSGMNWNMSSVQNFTLDGTAGGGTMTIGGELDMETSGDTPLDKAVNITIQNVAFNPSSPEVFISGPENSNITFNRDTFVAGNIGCSGGSPAGMGGVMYVQPTPNNTPSGVTAENSVFVASTDLWNPDRAIQDGSPMVVKNNVIAGFLDHTEALSCNHIDGLQWFSGINGTAGGTTFTGNLCYDDYGCAMAFDGTETNTVTDNVCFDTESACLNFYSDNPGSVIDHNVEQTGGADPGGCNTMNEPAAPIQACTYSQLLISSHKAGNRITSGQTFTNNIDPEAPNVESGDLATNTNNLYPGASSPNISGGPTFIGGTNPTSWSGFELTTGSIGHLGGSDGQDVGIRAGAGGPPTGGGSAPANTVAPALSGTAVKNNTLTTTNGTWNITGNVPTATTYMWWDCSTSTFSFTSCSPIEPQTAPVSANNSTYTLQDSDVGSYVFSEVTITNANGQVNAVSGAMGPVDFSNPPPSPSPTPPSPTPPTPPSPTPSPTPTPNPSPPSPPPSSPSPTPSPPPSYKPGDVNHDGVVNIYDLSILLSHYGTNYPNAEFTGHSTVTIYDLSTLLSRYGG